MKGLISKVQHLALIPCLLVLKQQCFFGLSIRSISGNTVSYTWWNCLGPRRVMEFALPSTMGILHYASFICCWFINISILVSVRVLPRIICSTWLFGYKVTVTCSWLDDSHRGLQLPSSRITSSLSEGPTMGVTCPDLKFIYVDRLLKLSWNIGNSGFDASRILPAKWS